MLQQQLNRKLRDSEISEAKKKKEKVEIRKDSRLDQMLHIVGE